MFRFVLLIFFNVLVCLYLNSQEIIQKDTILNDNDAIRLIELIATKPPLDWTHFISEDIQFNWCATSDENVDCNKDYFFKSYQTYINKELILKLNPSILIYNWNETGMIASNEEILNDFGEPIADSKIYTKCMIWSDDSFWCQFNFVLNTAKNNQWQIFYIHTNQ
jgi:hypothetical protein